MAEAAIDPDGPAAEAVPAKKRIRWWSALAKTLLLLVAGALLALAAAGLLLDTSLGHRVILDRIAAMTPNSGLRIRIGRIQGSIWGRTELRDVRLYDPDGLFAEAPKLTLDWQPVSWLFDRLAIQEVSSDLVIVHRLGRFEKGREDPTIPDYDISVGRFDIAQLRFERGVVGERRTARLSGEAEYRSGRFLLDLDAAMRDGGDRLSMLIDAAPDRDQFDLDLTLEAPAGGVLGKMIGAAVPLRAALRGEGSWRQWDGRARFAADGRDAGDLRVVVRAGHYGAMGWIAPAPLLGPRLAALIGPRTNVRTDGRLEQSVLTGRLAAESAALRLVLQGGADLRGNAWRDVRAGVVLLRPTALAGAVAASPGTRIAALLDGPFDDTRLSWRLTAPRLALGDAALEGVTASGSGRWAGRSISLPIAATARRIVGSGGELLADVRLRGTLRAEGDRLSGRDFALLSDRLRSTLRLDADLASGRTALAGRAASENYILAGVGTIDLAGDWRATSTGGGFDLGGTARGTVRRFDNGALEWAAGGPLRFESQVAAGADGAVRLPGLRLAAPRLQLTGSAQRGADGSLVVEGRGRQASLGPLSLRFAGSRLSLLLARPSQSLGLADVRVEVAPAARGFGYRAAGRSPLGRFTARGMVAPGGAAVQVAALNVSGANASGVLRPAGGGVAGTLMLRGALAGPLVFAAGGGEQRIDAQLVASDARFGRVPIGSGRIATAVSIGRAGALAGQAGFDGAADRLWAMAGVEGTSLTGPLTAQATIAGTSAAPVLSGTLALANGRFANSATGTSLEGIDARGRFDGERLVIESVGARTDGGGRISGAGAIGFGGAMDLRIETDSALLVARPDLRARVSGPIRIRSDGEGGSIAGDLRLSGARIRFGSAGSGGGGSGAGGGGWRLGLRVAAERVEVDGRGLDSVWGAALRVGGTTGAPSIVGEAQLVSGTYRVLGRPFELSRGTMRFEGESPPDPRLDILARAPGGGTAAVHITGRASRPEIGIANPLTSGRPDPPAAPPQSGVERALRPRRLRRSSTYRIRRGSASSPSASALPI